MSHEPSPDPKQWKIVAAKGRMDALTGTSAEQALHEAIKLCTHVALDLREVIYMSSAGLRVLLSSLKFASSRNGAFVLIRPQEAVREVLEMSGFSRIFQIVDDPSLLP